MVLNLEENSAGVVIFGDTRLIKEGDKVKTTGNILQTKVGEELLGRIVDPLAHPLDGSDPDIRPKASNSGSLHQVLHGSQFASD